MSFLRPRIVVGLLVMFAVSVVSALAFLAGNAPRDWSLHWSVPTTIVRTVSDAGDITVAQVPGGYDMMWPLSAQTMEYARFSSYGRRVSAPIGINGDISSPTSAHADDTTVLAWRQDTNGGSDLRAALLKPGTVPRRLLLATGSAPLEHPYAFALGHGIGVVYSWQRNNVFNVWLSRITPGGKVLPPVQLTRVATYAFNPHATVDAHGNIVMVFMNACCDDRTYKLDLMHFTPNGHAMGGTLTLGRIIIGSGTEGSTPNRWGLDVRQDGPQTWVAWAGGLGVTAAVVRGNSFVGPPRVVAPMQLTDFVALSLSGPEHQLIWRQAFDLGNYLAVMSLSDTGQPLGPPDRVAFEAAGDDDPYGVIRNGHPALVWLAMPTRSPDSQIELSTFSPHVYPAPSTWARLGLGLNNPLANLLILLVAGFAVGLLMTVGNIILVFGLVVFYLVMARLVHARWKWYLYAAILAVVLYAFFVNMGAPSPPLLFLRGLSGNTAFVAIAGMAIFVMALALMLRRTEDIYRAGIMAFAALYFIAFLQALILVQGQIAKI